MKDIVKKAIEQLERISEHLSAIGEKEDYTDIAIQALEQKPINISAMMYEIYMEGVNMTGEYQGCWVRFKDIEKIVDKYMAESEEDK